MRSRTQKVAGIPFTYISSAARLINCPDALDEYFQFLIKHPNFPLRRTYRYCPSNALKFVQNIRVIHLLLGIIQAHGAPHFGAPADHPWSAPNYTLLSDFIPEDFLLLPSLIPGAGIGVFSVCDFDMSDPQHMTLGFYEGTKLFSAKAVAERRNLKEEGELNYLFTITTSPFLAIDAEPLETTANETRGNWTRFINQTSVLGTENCCFGVTKDRRVAVDMIKPIFAGDELTLVYDNTKKRGDVLQFFTSSLKSTGKRE